MEDAPAADAFVHTVVRDWRSAPLTPANRALAAFAAKLTLRQQEMSPQDLEALRAHGFDDRAIHDAVQVIGYFNVTTQAVLRREVCVGVAGGGRRPATPTTSLFARQAE